MSLCTHKSKKLQVVYFFFEVLSCLYIFFLIFKFQDVLSESDKAMSVVKDLFGDDPKVNKLRSAVN